MEPLSASAMRRHAARRGWQTRRNGWTGLRKFHAYRKQVADGPARSLCCGLASRIALPIVGGACPGDPRPRVILWVAWRYAHGGASERERLGMRQVALCLGDDLLVTSAGMPPALRALEAISWCLAKSTSSMLWYVAYHLAGLVEASEESFYGELAAALVAMPLKPSRFTTMDGPGEGNGGA